MVSLDGRHAKQKMGSRAHVVRERSELALESICFVLNSCFLFLFLSNLAVRNVEPTAILIVVGSARAGDFWS